MSTYETTIKWDNMTPLNNEGKNSDVFVADDIQLKTQFVVKRIKKTDILKDYGDDSDTSLFAESRILYDIAHPNISEIQYGTSDNDYVCLVMPYYKNGSLESILDKQYLTVRQIIKYSLEFLSGLHYVHTKKLIHFDIKPTNILIDNTGKAVLTDFGLAKYTDLYGLASQRKHYSPHRAPEITSYGKYSSLTDIYQAGLTLYRMCNGNQSFRGHLKSYADRDSFIEAIKKGIFPDRKLYLPHIPLKLRKAINRAISVTPNDRQKTVLELLNEISTIDTNLDWLYDKQGNVESWSIVNDKNTHVDVYEVSPDKSGSITIKAFKRRLEDSNITHNKKESQSCKSLAEAYKIMEKIIKAKN